MKVVLVNDRPTLGGNSSSEFRVWICGAVGMGNNRYAEECGIVGEMSLENLYRNKEGNPYFWDMILLDWVSREKKITLLQNTSLQKANRVDNRIDSVECYQHTTEKYFTINSKTFADCTGNGVLAVLAGANWMYGTSDEYNVSQKPIDNPDKITSLGSSILFYNKKCEKPVKYVPPDFAYSKEEVMDVLKKTDKSISLNLNGCDYWWIEYGGMKNTIKDNDNISMELLKIIYGIWDYIKNSGQFDADCYTLEWVGSLPAQRESRRIISKYILKHEDLLSQRKHFDAVCYGGWPIDTHPCAGFFDLRESCEQFAVGPYDIPLSSLVCKDLDNVLLAGRNAGMSHLAMASARVMKTCALMGQAIGLASGLSKKIGRFPNQFSSNDIDVLQQMLLRDDVWIIGVKNNDIDDLVQKAKISGDSGVLFGSQLFEKYIPIKQDVSIILPPLPDNTVISLLLEIEKNHKVTVDVWCSIKPENYDMAKTINAFTFDGNNSGWVNISSISWGEGNVILHIPACIGVKLGITEDELPGILGIFSPFAKGLDMFNPIIKASNEYKPYEPINIANGFNRPYGGPNLWLAPLKKDGTQILIDFEKPYDISSLHLYLDISLFRDYNNLRPAIRNESWENMPPNLAREIIISFRGHDYENKLTVSNNRQRHVQISVKEKDITSIHISVTQSWGGKYAAIYEVRVYEKNDIVY